MTKPLKRLGFITLSAIALTAFCQPSKAGFLTGSGTSFYSDDSKLGDVFNGGTPATFSVSGNQNGMTYDSTYNSNFTVSSHLTVTFESLVFNIGGSNTDVNQVFRPTATVTGQAAVEYIGLANPLYNEAFYGSLNGVLSYHLAIGDALNYTVGASISAPGFSAPFLDYTATATTSTPGDYSVNFVVPSTFLTDLVALHNHGATYMQTNFTIIAKLTRGNDGSDITTINFDPDVNAQGIPNTGAITPEPTTLAIWSLGALGCAVAGYRRRKAA